MSAEKIGDIKEQLKSITDSQLTQFIEAYGSDERGGVIKLVDSAKKRLDKYEKELIRTDGLKKYEREYASYAHICGIDEVGRGPLAGPVVACAVILPKDCDILYINDSKKLSAAKREALYDKIMEKAVAVGVGLVGPQRIDEINILQATFLAMERAMQKLSPQPELALIDGNRTKDFGLPVRTIVKGDSLSASIAAASILAKVTRDRLMEEYDAQYPQYGFAVHKGYGTKRHYEALREFGPSPIHRKTFLKKFYENP